MNLRKRVRNFFTLTHGRDDGFTLVELIVVIAILAILGGVGVPAYSGYVEKANEAADAQLLADMNKAFAAACLSVGVDNYAAPGAAADADTMTVTITGDKATDFAAMFETFFDNEGKFKKTNSLLYSLDIGGFKAFTPDAIFVLAYGDGFVQVTGAAIQALLDSTYYGEGMDSVKLMNQVDRVAKIAGGMGTIANVMATEGYVNAALTALGITPTDSFEENVKLMNDRAKKLALEKMGITEDQLGASNQAQYNAILEDISNNALVLYTAQSTSQMTATEAKKLLNGVNSGMIKKAMNEGLTDEEKATGMNQAALAYGMYYSYVNSDYCTKDLEKNSIVATDVITALDNNTEFTEYMASEQGTKDMEAYLQALNVINSSTQSTEAVEKIIVEGFTDPDLLSILTQTMGK